MIKRWSLLLYAITVIILLLTSMFILVAVTIFPGKQLSSVLIIVTIVSVAIFPLFKKAAAYMAKPLLRIDADHPEQSDTYAELTPVLRRLSDQNRQLVIQQAEFRRQHSEFSTITENMSEGLILIDQDKNILFHNTKLRELLHFGNGPIKGQSVFVLNRSESFRTAVELAMEGSHNEQLFSLGNGYFQLLASPVWQEWSVVGAVLVILDVTEKEERENLRREFTANVSHELKTPLTSISGIAEIMKDGIVRPQDIAHFAGTIYEESQRMIRLIGDIIKLSRLDEDTGLAELQPVELTALTQAVLASLHPMAKQRGITLHIQGNPCIIQGIPTMLEEMLYNLLDNAIKYNKENGTVTVSVTQDSKHILLSVTDTGIGIPTDQQSRVFERFYRVDKSHSKEISGTGLGLSIVKHSAAYHHAVISLQSTPGKGTTVTIRFEKASPQPR